MHGTVFINGQNATGGNLDIFTNDYYVNDMSQDKKIGDEIRANKLAIEEAKQQQANN